MPRDDVADIKTKSSAELLAMIYSISKSVMLYLLAYDRDTGADRYDGLILRILQRTA
jgi:hypothetical protein